MQLSYRGIRYNHEPLTLEVSEGEIQGKYRGQDWRYHYLKHIPQLSGKFYRQYRGIAYSTSPLPIVKQEESDDKSCSVPFKVPQKIIQNSLSETHLENIRRSLEHRLQIAQANGNQDLINLLQQESQQLARLESQGLS